jgi:hypothetical protein
VWQAVGAAGCDHLRELTVEKVLAIRPASGLKHPFTGIATGQMSSASPPTTTRHGTKHCVDGVPIFGWPLPVVFQFLHGGTPQKALPEPPGVRVRVRRRAVLVTKVVLPSTSSRRLPKW